METYTALTVFPGDDLTTRVVPSSSGPIGSVHIGDAVKVQSSDPAELEALADRLIEVVGEMRAAAARKGVAA